MRLDLTEWKLAGYWPYTPIQQGSMETGHVHQGLTGVIDAKVPGSIYADLLRAGLIPDPYYDMNSLQCEWVKDRWWVYATTFSIKREEAGDVVRLVFQGIDYKARIYLNGEHLADHEGMYEPVILDVTEKIRYDQENYIKVILENAPDEMGQIGYTSQTYTQKARFTYKWDFCTRLVGMGIWEDVYLLTTGKTFRRQSNLVTDSSSLQYSAEVCGKGSAKAVLYDNGTQVAQAQAEIQSGKVVLNMDVENPKLWWPNGYGDQPLYDLEVVFYDESGKESDREVLKTAFRTLSYAQCDDAIASALPYIPVYNGKKIYIKGVNCTPLDMMYGCVDEKRYDTFLKLAKEANVNLIRVWGGGIIEKEAFYRLCDKYGLMVWQEFIQSSSGLDNCPSKRPEFLALAEKTARYAVQSRRKHISLTFWSGGNELMDMSGKPSTFGDENIHMLYEIVKQYDPVHQMLPTSASGPVAWVNYEHPEYNHDVHGPWKYAGVKEHYHLYNVSPIQLHSEFGVDGMANYENIPKFLSGKHQVVTTMGEDMVWKHHGEWWDTYGYREHPVFGDIDSLKTFSTLSQFMQAEGIRYALEANRRRKWKNCGSIVWQFNEPWPNISCTNLVDYYGTPKLAYYFYRDAMKPWHVSMKYDALIWNENETFRGELFVHDDLGQGYDSVSVTVRDGEGNILFEKTDKSAFSFELPVKAQFGDFFTVSCKVGKDGRADENRYLFFITSKEKPYASQAAAQNYVNSYSRNSGWNESRS